MCLLSPENFHKTTTQLAQPSLTSIKKNKEKTVRKSNPRHKRKKKTHVTEKQHPYNKWVMTRKKNRGNQCETRGSDKRICKFFRRVLPTNTVLQQLPTENEPLEKSVRTPRRLEEEEEEEETVPILPSTSPSSPSGDIVFETQKKKQS